MSSISVTLNGIDQTISRPVVIDIINQVEEITKIDKNTKILFPGVEGHMYQPGSSIDDANRNAEFLNNHFVQIEVTEDFQKESLGTQVLAGDENIPIFYDDKLKVIIKPSYATVDVTINFKYRTNSRSEAKRWRDDVYMRTSQLRDQNVHRIRYSYSFPSAYLELLKVIHSLRENIAPYNQSFEDYFKSNATDRFTNISSMGGVESNLVVAETQGRIIGMFDFEGVPEKEEKDNANSSWIISFGYKFSYDKPIMCNMKYPIMIHNQLLPAEYVTLNNSFENPDDVLYVAPLSVNAMHSFESQSDISRYKPNSAKVYMIPDHDEFIPDMEINGTSTIFYALCTVETDGVTLLNLNELGDIVLDKDILNFLATSEAIFVTKQYQSLYQLTLYSNNSINNSNSLILDSNLNVKAMLPLDLRVCNRIRFSMIHDLSYLNANAIDRIKNNPNVFVKSISAMNDALATFPGLKYISTAKVVSDINFTTISNLLSGVVLDTSINYVRSAPSIPGGNLVNGIYKFTTNPVVNTAKLQDTLTYSNANMSTNQQYNPYNIFSQLTQQSLADLSNSVMKSARTQMNTSIIAIKG